MRRCGTIISLTGCLCSSTYIKDTIKGPEQSSWVFNLNEANEELKSAFSQLTSREATEQKQNKKNMQALACIFAQENELSLDSVPQ